MSVEAGMPVLLSKKRWLFDIDEDSSKILHIVEEFVRRINKDDCEQVFINQSAAEFIYSSNLMEKTLPLGVSKHDTFLCLASGESESVSWNADGSTTQSQMRSQMLQHCKALRLASAWSRDPAHRLTADYVCQLHKVLMLHSSDENGDPLPVGEIRTCAAYTSGHIYPAASKEGLEMAINKYHHCLDKKYHFLVCATVLFYEVIQVHPFQDGNGRLCRILLNYALEREGFPFAVPLTSGHSKARKHYILAICNAQK
jgi:fido (protein-threonine AMPylation protein)